MNYNSQVFTEINIYKPSFLWNIGAFIAIFIASLYSLLIITLPITIPLIVFTALSVKRSYFFKNNFSRKFLPIILNVILLIMVVLIFSLLFKTIDGILSWFSNSFLNDIPYLKTVILDVGKGATKSTIYYRIFIYFIPTLQIISILMILFGWNWNKKVKIPLQS